MPVNGTSLAELGISAVDRVSLGELGINTDLIGGANLSSNLIQIDPALRGVSLVGQSTLRGLLTAALGGKFSDGFKQAAGNPENLVQAFERSIPLGRIGKPDDLPGAILFFASDDAAYITGQVLSVSGGLTMNG